MHIDNLAHCSIRIWFYYEDSGGCGVFMIYDSIIEGCKLLMFYNKRVATTYFIAKLLVANKNISSVK